MKLIAGCTFAFVALASARAEVKTKVVEYDSGGTTLQGFLAWDEGGEAAAKRPGVLVVHEWWGHNEHVRKQAQRLAKEGYVAFALDMYGGARSTTHPADAKAFMEEVTKDPKLVRARFDAALEVLRSQPQVDPERIAAVGYCMGGTIALGMARAGADLDAVVALHAGLKPSGPPAEKGDVKARILVLTGGADPFVPKEHVAEFQKEMKAAGAKAEVVTLPKAKHGFTNPDADKAGMEALGYDAGADRKSFDAMRKFLRGALRP
jgi:dienelactone hydrolase